MTQELVPRDGSPWTTSRVPIHSRKSSSLARVLNTFFCCMDLSVIETCDANLVSTLLNIAAPHLIFLSLMSSWAIVCNRENDFCLRAIQVTILETLSKQSRKKDSFHSISEAGTRTEERGQRGTKRDKKNFSNFFHRTCDSAVT
jgi:hypothetical protein